MVVKYVYIISMIYESVNESCHNKSMSQFHGKISDTGLTHTPPYLRINNF